MNYNQRRILILGRTHEEVATAIAQRVRKSKEDLGLKPDVFLTGMVTKQELLNRDGSDRFQAELKTWLDTIGDDEIIACYRQGNSHCGSFGYIVLREPGKHTSFQTGGFIID